MIDVEQLKQQIDIVEVISQYTELKKSGRVYKGLCRLHQENTPSFFVYPESNSWYCYGCGEGGDVLSFIEKVEGISFREALNKLCDGDTNICEIDYSRNKMREFMRLVEELKQIDTGQVFGEHLVARYKQNQHKMFADKFKMSTLDYFNIGYCSEPSDELLGRVTIPWYSVDNELVAIEGRATHDSKSKYLAKTGSTKGNHLYNLNNAKKHAKEGLMVVEDTKSVMRLYEFGYFNAVALGNCDLSDRKYLLRQYADKIILALDECESGYKATKKIYDECKHMFVVEELRWHEKYKDIAEIRDKEYFDKCYERRRRL